MPLWSPRQRFSWLTKVNFNIKKVRTTINSFIFIIKAKKKNTTNKIKQNKKEKPRKEGYLFELKQINYKPGSQLS